jgi:hypothetical protein
MSSEKNQIPAAFLCYTHFDDKHNQGQLTEFRKLLSAEVRAQTGEEFLIFQDRDSIEWGQNWEERIWQTLNETSFLIPVITPSFFNSLECRKELHIFLTREQELNRTDLILPLYYIEVPIIEDESKRQTEEIARVIASHQWADWRELRFESPSSIEVRRRVAKLASHIRNALVRPKSAIQSDSVLGTNDSISNENEGRKGWQEFIEAMDRLTALNHRIFPLMNKHIEKMNEYLERYEKSSTPALKKRNLSLAASQLRNGAKLFEDKLPEINDTIEDSTGYILGYPSRRDPSSERDRKELSDFRSELTKVLNSIKPQLELGPQMRFKVLRLGDLGQEMDAGSQRMAKAFMAFLAPFQRLYDVMEGAIKEIDDLLNS